MIQIPKQKLLINKIVYIRFNKGHLGSSLINQEKRKDLQAQY